MIAQHKNHFRLALFANLFSKRKKLFQHPWRTPCSGMEQIADNDQLFGSMISDEVGEPAEILLGRTLRHWQTRAAKSGGLAEVKVRADQCLCGWQKCGPAWKQGDVDAGQTLTSLHS